MPWICLDEKRFSFPPLAVADEDGLLLIGGRVTAQRVLQAYAKGIFPWYNHDSLPLWYSPNPRFVLFPGELHTSRSMKKVLANGSLHFKTNTAFEEVIEQCSHIPRRGQSGTWITNEMKTVYTQLHREGHAHSAEAWRGANLVGGVYGIRIGNVFFGESMFSKESNASKFAFINYVQQLKADDVELIDCQVYTDHVHSLGGRLIERSDYVKLLAEFI